MIIVGDCIEKMREMEDCSVDAIVTDPPYGLSFMGKDWDHGVPGVAFWKEALRVAKPGAHLLAFGGTRTFHRLTVEIEDAGWEIRDCVMWVYGSGFPKSHDVSKAIDKAAGAEREVVGRLANARPNSHGRNGIPVGSAGLANGSGLLTSPSTDAAKKWDGWGTALKPAWEPIIVARKPLCGTVAENVLKHGTGGINVDGCRVGRDADDVSGWSQSGSVASENRAMSGGNYAREPRPDASGRWPANVIHDGSEEVLAEFPMTVSSIRKPSGKDDRGVPGFVMLRVDNKERGHGDTGSAARFFYCAKASKADRDEGCEGLELKPCGTMEDDNYDIKTGSGNSRDTQRRNFHPTVKPTDLMRYLCRLVTPPCGIVLDPFMGSGSTGKAAVLEGFDFIGIEKDEEYCKIAEARIKNAKNKLRESAPLFAND